MTNYTEADLFRGRKIARSKAWRGERGYSLSEHIAKTIAEERAQMRAEMLGRVARTEGEIEHMIETLWKIWGIVKEGRERSQTFPPRLGIDEQTRAISRGIYDV